MLFLSIISLLFSPLDNLVSPQHNLSVILPSKLWDLINASIYPYWQLLTMKIGTFLDVSSITLSIPSNKACLLFPSGSHFQILPFHPSSHFCLFLAYIGNSYAIEYIGNPMHPCNSSFVIGGLFMPPFIFINSFQASAISDVESHKVPSRSNRIPFVLNVDILYYLLYYKNYFTNVRYIRQLCNFIVFCNRIFIGWIFSN